MKKLTWWFRIVGAFYMLLAIMNMYALFVNPGVLKSSIPFPLDDLGLKVALDMWSPFAFDLLGIGTFLLWASRNPQKYIGVVWFTVWLEFLHGVLDDLFLISRGYDAAGYIGFTVVHLIIIATGIVFVRQVEAQSSQPAPLVTQGNV